MKIIKPGKPSVRKILGSQRRKSGICRKMRYVLEARGEGGLRLLNTITGDLAELDPAEAAAWQALPQELSETLAELYRLHFLVPEAFDERKTVEQIRAVLRLTTRTKSFHSFVILPTTACNARCFYCYESGYPHHTMTEKTAEDTVQFILKNCGSLRKTKIHWFGGEPLVGKDRIAQICRRLGEEAFEFSSKMTSNGYLFTPELVREAKEDWHLTFVQITLDGTEAIYNRTKAYAGADGSPYYRVLGNIESLLDAGIRVSVRMNLDRHNEQDLAHLIDELAERFAGKAGLACYTHELFDQQGFEPIRHTGSEWDEIARRRHELDHRIEEAGLSLAGESRGLPSLRMNFCMADSPESALINPLGELGKCEHVPYDPPFGDVRGGVRDPAILDKWLNSEFEDSCAACELYPYCARMTTCPTKDPCREDTRREELSRFRKNMLAARADETKEEPDGPELTDC